MSAGKLSVACIIVRGEARGNSARDGYLTCLSAASEAGCGNGGGTAEVLPAAGKATASAAATRRSLLEIPRIYTTAFATEETRTTQAL